MKKQLRYETLSVPNILSYTRILLIPLIVWLYCFERNYYLAAAAVAISGLTDMADGNIARKYNMVTDIGKLVDPLADKLTQVALIFCLLTRYKLMALLFVILFVKEAYQLTVGAIIIKRTGVISSAKWYGKVSTTVLYMVMITLIIFPQLQITIINSLILLCAGFMVFTFAMYTFNNLRLIKSIDIKE